MSATGRGRDRIKDDAYETPDWLTEAILPEVLPTKWGNPNEEFNILEPCCGTGRIIECIEKFNTPAPLCIDAIDIRDSGTGRVGDFLEETPEPIFDLVITNPPYSLAMEFIQHGMKFLRNADSRLVYLLRLGFLSSKKRAVWMRENTPSIYVTPKRPSFFEGTDQTDYAWFEWYKGRRVPTVRILETEHIVTRRSKKC